MTNRERVIAALQHRETDYVPYNVFLTDLEYRRLAEYFKDRNFLNRFNNHIAMAASDDVFEEVGEEKFKDNFGVIWDRSGADKDIGVIANKVLPEPDLYGFSLPEIKEEILRKNLEELMSEKERGQFAFASIGFCMFERAWSLCGMENVLMYMLCEEDFLNELFDKICERNCRVIDIALEYDIDGFHFGDDWGQQQGLIMGAPLWRKFIKPRMARMYKKVKDAGKFVSQHSCGDLRTILEDLVEIGLDCYQTVQPEIYDLKELKEKYGSKLTFWGGISTQRLLSQKDPEYIEKVTRETLEIMKKGGGYILAPTHAVEHDVSPENMEAFWKVAINQKI